MNGETRWYDSERWFAAATILLCAAVFWGNTLVAAAHGLAIVGLITALVQRKFAWSWKRFSASSWCLIGFAIFALLSVLVNFSSYDGVSGSFKKLRYEVMAVLFLGLPVASRLLVRSVLFRDLCFVAWLGGLIVTTVIGLVVFFFGDDYPFLQNIGYQGRVAGIYGQVMTYANVLLISAVALASLVVQPRILKQLTRIPPFVFYATTVFSGIGLYFTYTRGAVLAAAVGLITLAFLHSRRLVIAVAVLALGFALYAAKDHYGGVGKSRYFEAHDPVRLNQWQASIFAFVENPVFGVGFLNFEPQSMTLKERYGLKPAKAVGNRKNRKWVYFKGHSHSNYLEAFATTGLFGGLCFLGFSVFWLLETYRSNHAVLLVPTVVAFGVAGAFENSFFDSEVLSAVLLFYFISRMAVLQEARVTPLSPPSSA